MRIARPDSSAVPTLVFHARSVPGSWQRTVAETIAGRVRRQAHLLPAWLRRSPRVSFALDREYERLSYVLDWLDAFRATPRLAIELCDVNDALAYRAGLRKMGRVPLTIVLHSAAGDNLERLRKAESAFQDRSGKLVVFIGNEYNLMPDKIGFVRATEADFIASQLPVTSAQWLYAEAHRSTVVAAPPGLNPALYRDLGRHRVTDIGFRGDLYDKMFALGDLERSGLLNYFAVHSQMLGLSHDIAFERYPRAQWCEFLNTCRGIVGAESGTYYLERDDRTRIEVSEYLASRPNASFAEVFDRFFRDHPGRVSGKAISSRHFEPVGTKTCQILLHGHYNGLLVPDEHFISLKKDYSNIDDVVRRFKDPEYRTAMVDRTYKYVMSSHTYRHRIDSILDAVLGVSSAPSTT